MKKQTYITPSIKVHPLDLSRVMDNMTGGGSGTKDEGEIEAKSSTLDFIGSFDDEK